MILTTLFLFTLSPAFIPTDTILPTISAFVGMLIKSFPLANYASPRINLYVQTQILYSLSFILAKQSKIRASLFFRCCWSKTRKNKEQNDCNIAFVTALLHRELVVGQQEIPLSGEYNLSIIIEVFFIEAMVQRNYTAHVFKGSMSGNSSCRRVKSLMQHFLIFLKESTGGFLQVLGRFFINQIFNLKHLLT